MTPDVFEFFLSRAQDAAAFLYIDGALLPLLALPPAAALCLAAVGLFLPRGRAALRRALRAVRLACGGLLLALFLLAGAPAPAYGVIVLAQLLACALALPLYIPARQKAPAAKQPVLPRAAKGAKARPQRPQTDAPCAVRPIPPAEARPRPIPPAPPAGEGQAAFHAPPPLQPAPPAAAPPQPAREGSVVVERDVRLGHIFTALERLRDLPLSAGDRLEAQKTEELLTVYRAKGALSAAEAETLNDILAALLKMMAKYRL